MYKIAVIEDDEHLLAAIQRRLDASSHFFCIATAGSIEEYWEKIPQRAQPDALILDIYLPGKSGIEALPQLIKKYPSAEIIIHSVSEKSEDLILALQRGATGYIIKNSNSSDLITQLERLLIHHEALLSPLMAKHLIRHLQPIRKELLQVQEPVLNSQQRLIMEYLSQGLKTGEIANIMDLSVAGVKYHLAKIYDIIQANTRAQAIAKYQQLFNKHKN